MSPALISEELARFVDGIAADHIPFRAIARAKFLILDAVGIALASITYEFSQAMVVAIADLSGPGDAVVIGTPLQVPIQCFARAFAGSSAKDRIACPVARCSCRCE